MKRVICLLSVMLLLLCGCGGELPFFVKDVSESTDFRCHMSCGDSETVLYGDDAKAAYDLITEALRNMQDTTEGPKGQSIGMIFWVGDGDPRTDTVPFDRQYGCYSVSEEGIGMYVATIDTSCSFHYQVKPAVYTALLKMME